MEGPVVVMRVRKRTATDSTTITTTTSIVDEEDKDKEDNDSNSNDDSIDDDRRRSAKRTALACDPARALPVVVVRRRTGIVHDVRLRMHRHPLRTHPEKPERIDAALESLRARGFLADCTVLSCAQLPKEVAAAAHYSSYLTLLAQLKNAACEELVERMNDFESMFANEHSIDCAFLAAGGLIRLVERVIEGSLRNGFALIRPPGHHAEPHTAMGFSFLNNVAIAAKYAVNRLGLQRVLVLDWDVHHGNGTQRIFYQDPSVLYISIHRYDHGRFFPGTCEGSSTRVGHAAGKGFNVNIPFNGAGIGDGEFVRAFETLVQPIASEFDPELILVSAGFDAASGDPIGQCDVSPSCFEWMTNELKQLARGRVVLTLEGGYRPSTVAECVSRCVQALTNESDLRALSEWKEHVTKHCCSRGGTDASIDAAIAAQKPFWKRLDDDQNSPQPSS